MSARALKIEHSVPMPTTWHETAKAMKPGDSVLLEKPEYPDPFKSGRSLYFSGRKIHAGSRWAVRSLDGGRACRVWRMS